MTNVEALKQVYISLGGMLTDTYPTIANGVPVSDYNLISDVVAVISFKTGSGLPNVTAEDKGKVLTVDDDGDWTAAAPSDGVNVIYGTRTGLLTFEFNTTSQERLAILNERKPTFIYLKGSVSYPDMCLSPCGRSTDYWMFTSFGGFGSSSVASVSIFLLGISTTTGTGYMNYKNVSLS